MLATGEPVRVEDFRHDERVARAARENLDLGPAILFPLGGPGDARGVLTVGRHPGAHAADQAAAELVDAFAAQAGIALELAERRRDAERLAVFEDRDRIARDLHDLVIQRLYASGMKLQGTIPLIDRQAAEDRVSSVVDDMDVTINDIRQAIFDLQARGTAPPGLRDQVMVVIEEMTEPMGMTSSLRLDRRLDEQVPGDIGEDMLHALREALSNAARHGKATGVEVSIGLGSELSLLVRDNGTGFPATSRRSGLANLAAGPNSTTAPSLSARRRAAERSCSGGCRFRPAAPRRSRALPVAYSITQRRPGWRSSPRGGFPARPG